MFLAIKFCWFCEVVCLKKINSLSGLGTIIKITNNKVKNQEKKQETSKKIYKNVIMQKNWKIKHISMQYRILSHKK